MFTTSLAVVLICVGAILDFKTCNPVRDMAPLRPTNLFLALGTFLFSYGGHSAFPTIQVRSRNNQIRLASPGLTHFDRCSFSCSCA